MSNFFEKNYLFDEWNVIEKNFDIDRMPFSSKVFETSNGYIKMTGEFEEEVCLNNKEYLKGTSVNGFYEIAYNSSENKGSLENKITNVIEAKYIKLYIDDEEFNIKDGVFLEYERKLDLKDGVLYRHLIWQSSKGRRIEVNVKRIVSFENKHLSAISYEVIPLNFSGRIKIVSYVKLENQLKILDKKFKDSFCFAVGETYNTKFKVTCGVENSVFCEGKYEFKSQEEDNAIEFIYDFEGEVNKKIQLDKFILYFTSKNCEMDRKMSKVLDELIAVKTQGFIEIEKSQKNFLSGFWKKINKKSSNNKNIQNIVRFNEFKLLQKYGEEYSLT